jgi:hypothetical protein
MACSTTKPLFRPAAAETPATTTTATLLVDEQQPKQLVADGISEQLHVVQRSSANQSLCISTSFTDSPL